MTPGIEISDETCAPARTILAHIGGRWSLLIVLALNDGPVRFNALKRALSGITQRMLTLTLRSLERDGLVKRTVTPTVPARVDYALTPLGKSLCEPVELLGQWVVENQDKVVRSQHEFDETKLAA